VIVLSDTSPLNCLILLGHVDVLPALFGEIVVPAAVLGEMNHSGSPQEVHVWVSRPPKWLAVRNPKHVDPTIHLGRGETEAICLAMELRADLLLMDDRRGRREAEARGLFVAGTLNVLEAAADREMLDLRSAVARLRLTNFHISDRMIAAALANDAERRKQRGE
jgi:predicted nucleic acid-binding protein